MDSKIKIKQRQESVEIEAVRKIESHKNWPLFLRMFSNNYRVKMGL